MQRAAFLTIASLLATALIACHRDANSPGTVVAAPATPATEPAPMPEPPLESVADEESAEPNAASTRVAQVLEAVRSEHVDLLIHSDEGMSLWTIAGATMLCRRTTEMACFVWPAPSRVSRFDCWDGDPPCAVEVEHEGQIESWHVAVNAEGARRRLVERRPAADGPLRGPMYAPGRRMRGAEETLPRVTELPAVLDDPRLARPPLREDAMGYTDCAPTVRAVVGNDLVIRVVGCEVDDFATWPTAIVATHAGVESVTHLFTTDVGPLEPVQFEPLGALSVGAIGWRAQQDNGGSPSGSMRHELWVLVPARADQPVRLHALSLGWDETEGLGAGIERPSEGYVVGVDRMRATFEVTGVGRARYTGCELWRGTHARISDRWRGRHVAATLDLPIAFDDVEGFTLDESSERIFEERCGIEH